MKWSRYSKLFKSKRNGWLLYNSASNAFLKIDENAVPVIQEIIKSPKTYDFGNAVSLYFQLRTSGFLVEDTKDDDLFNILKMRRLLVGYATDALTLTIAPTRNCNFGCPYCYETNRTKSMMSNETVENLLKFIEMHKQARSLFLIWYGGEPLLAYKKVKQINAGVEELEIPYSSKMITNGYCLTSKICEELNDMHISTIQITIDGDKEIHNRRRFLIGGGKTFDRIVDNIDTLLTSSWKGTLNLRVNVDTRNSKEFANVYRFIQSKYDNEILNRIYIYPGFVHGEDTSPDISCFFDYVKKGEFVAKLAREENITPLPIFPQSTCTACTLVQHNSYVVGPNGELYKCWHDVGEEDKVIGNVASFKNWNMALVAEGMVSGNYLEDVRCEKCFFFPVCDGGCPKVRMLNKRDGKKRDHCSYFKNNLEELLEIHYEQKYGKETAKT
ncbi:MAG: radical SAM protein [Streptococcaceae bacterium]|jgi:uncharacterized protein|nr:radical SAM protein [Streptococcaceae bacterium]